MTKADMLGRRRFLSILAACAGVGLSGAARSAVRSDVTTWRGSALGALASMTLVHPDTARARRQLQYCLAEIQRLEAILSLYRPDSALVRLNAAGELSAPPHELSELLAFALSLSRASEGAFDPTVQPLYRLYSDHFAVAGADARGPSPQAIAQVLRKVDYRAVEVRSHHIRLRRPGMAITLNGIAQGYVTDRVTELLRDAGFDNVLVDLGEARALGHRPGGGAWRAAIGDPRDSTRHLLTLGLGGARDGLCALATSAGLGTRFGTDPRVHHLFDPHTGRSANHHLSVSVAAARATLADGLSTTLSTVPRTRGVEILSRYPGVRAYFMDSSGRVSVHGPA